MNPVITNDAVILGILFAILAMVFVTSSSASRGWKRFYTIIPPILVCYFLPSLLTSTGLVDPERSKLYYAAKMYFLPTSLALLTLSIDLAAIRRLGPKAVILFLTGTVSIIVGGPVAMLLVGLVRPDWIGGEGAESVWKGMTTVAGSWIGGGANQTAMREMHGVGDIYTTCVAVDVFVANIWTACLLTMAGKSKAIDAKIGADTSAIEDLKRRISDYQATVLRTPRLADTIVVLAVGFGVTAVSHVVADAVAPWIKETAPTLKKLNLDSKFFWIAITATTIGLTLSFTRARALEGVGASRIGSVCLYFLVVTIGMNMDLRSLADRPELFVIGGIWMLFHAAAMLGMCRILRAPVFFMAVGSQANVGGAASAPVVASAFHPTLATVGVLLAALGYALGTYGALLCGKLMELVAGWLAG